MVGQCSLSADTTDIWGNKEGLVEEGGGSVTKKPPKKNPIQEHVKDCFPSLFSFPSSVAF